MYVDGFAYRWRAVLLLIVFLLVTCTVLAEEGVLVLVVMDTEQHPFANVRIGAARRRRDLHSSPTRTARPGLSSHPTPSRPHG